MATIYDIKKQSDELSLKTNINSIPPKEVGGLIRDLADYVFNVEINGGSLGIRKVYVSVAAMEVDTEPVGIDGKLLKRGNLVSIYDGTDTGVDNNKIYAYQKPGWTLVNKMDAAYAKISDLEELRSADNKLSERLTNQSDNNIICAKFDNQGQEIKSTYAEKTELSEYNISVNYPTGGIDNSNVYTFETAIVKMPVNLRKAGAKCLFLAYDEANKKVHTEIWVFNGGIFVDKTNWMKLATQSEEEDINNILQESISSLSQEINKEMTLAINQIDTKVDEAVKDKISKPLIISQAENKAGTYNVGGESIDIWERSVQLLSLPKTQDESKEYVIADEPLGFGTYVNIESFTASSGKGLNKEFFNFNYDITRFYINSQLQTCVVLKCKNALNEDINGLMHIQYCKFWGDVVEFDITLPSSVNKDALTLEIPPLKYNKKMVFSYITDDSYSIYQYIFSQINKRLMVKKFGTDAGANYTWHLGMQGDSKYNAYIKESYYPEHFAQCTDGAGVKHRYATTVSVWADKLKDQRIGQDVGMQWPWMSEKEFKLFFDFGFMCAYHDLIGYEKDKVNTQEEYDKCVEDSVALFKEYVGIVPKLMVEPNGDHKYIDFSQRNDIIQVITAQTGDDRIQLVYPFKNDFSLDKSDVTIKRIFAYGTSDEYTGDLLDILSTFNSATDKSTIYWLIGSAHRSDLWESELITKIHELYGDIGDDSLWFPTMDEFFEYWYMRTNTLSVKTITDTGVHYKMYVPKGANFFFRDLSVLISGISTLEGVAITSGENVYGTSFAMNDGKLLVNLDFNPLLMERVNKYVEAFEADYNAEYAYDDAYYFVQKLKDGLREPYLTRINKWVSPPVLESFSINNGQEFTQDQNVTLNITYSGQAPSHYMVSESSSFVGASWVEYVENPTFKLSSGFNAKTVYLKLKNVYGETGTLSDGITLLEPTLALNSITINDGAASTIQRNVSVAFGYVGYPTHYMISESSSFTGAAWVEFAENPLVQLSATYGNKILYAKLKNATTETVSKSAIIELIDTVTARLNSILINNGDASTDSGSVSVKFETLNTITKYKIGKQADLSDCAEWIVWSGSTVQYSSDIVDGNLTVYAQVGNETTESSIKSDSILVVQPVVLISITLAGGEDSFAGYTVPVSFEISSGTPTHYRLAETSAGLSSAVWLAWKDNITYKFSAIGSKTLYAQVKNALSESGIVNDSISLTEPPVKMILGFNGTATNTVETETANGETINQIRPGSYSSWSAQQLKDNQGNKLQWYFNFESSKYLQNSVFAGDSMNNYEGNSTANDDGVFPVSTYLKCLSAMNVATDGSKKLRLSFRLPNGHYKARILYSPGEYFLMEESFRVNSYYGVFEGTDERAKVNVATPGFTGKGNNQYNNEFEFDVTKDPVGVDIDFAAWQEGTPVKGYRPGINLIELTKLS